MAKKSNPYKHYNLPQTYEEFCDTILENLGAPLVNVEITPKQLQNCVSRGIQYYLEYDSEGFCECWWIHPVCEDDQKNGYLTIPMDVLDVMEILTPGSNVLYSDATDGNISSYSISSISSVETAWNNPTYLWWNNYWNYFNTYSGSQSLFYYEVSMQYIGTMRALFNAKVEYSYRRRERKLYPLSKPIKKGELFCLYGTKMLDPETDDSLWSSDFLLKYCTALCGQMWGVNLTKFGNVPSAGGLTINGEEILRRYSEMVEKLEEEHRQRYEEPPMPYIA